MVTLALTPGTETQVGADGAADRVRLAGPRGSITFHDPAAGLAAVVRRLGSGPCGPEAWDTAADPALCADLARAVAAGLLSLAAADPRTGRVVATAEATGTLARPDLLARPARPVRLSRFVTIRRDGEVLRATSPVAHFTVTVTAPAAAAALARLAYPAEGGEPAGPDRAAGDGGSPLADDLVRLLGMTGLVQEIGEDGTLPEDTDPVLREREVEELVLHGHSRRGLTPAPVGATYRFEGELEPEPAVRSTRPDAPVVELPRVDLTGPGRMAMPLGTVMERRRSVRDHGDPPLDLAALAEFLQRTARVQQLIPMDRDLGVRYESSRRPYPSGGAAYDLEIYLAVRACTGVEPGFYRYEADRHVLTLVSSDGRSVNRLLRDARQSSLSEGYPQVLVVLASRFRRLAWKYQGIAYVTVLKNVGVLYEAMYLAATAMGLAPCALGAGNAAVFHDLTGLDPAVESSVGEFMLGSRRAGERP